MDSQNNVWTSYPFESYLYPYTFDSKNLSWLKAYKIINNYLRKFYVITWLINILYYRFPFSYNINKKLHTIRRAYRMILECEIMNILYNKQRFSWQIRFLHTCGKTNLFLNSVFFWKAKLFEIETRSPYDILVTACHIIIYTYL